MYPSWPGLATSDFAVLLCQDGAVSSVSLPVFFACYFFSGINPEKKKEMSP